MVDSYTGPDRGAELNAILDMRLRTLHTDVTDMKGALRDLTHAITRLALIEERQAQAAQAQERAFNALEKVEARLSQLEQRTPANVAERLAALEMRVPESTRTSLWVERAIIALVAAGAGTVFGLTKL